MTCSCSKSTRLWAASLLVIIIIGALTVFAYTSEQNALKSVTQAGMKSTVSVMATQVHAGDLANITTGSETSPEYLTVATNLQTMRSMDDHILNAYILKVYPNKTAIFLVDDLYPDDPAGSAKTGEVSTAPDKMEIFAALSGPTTSREPYTTQYGSFMSAYAPIDDSLGDSSGNTAAVLAIDMSAKDYNDATTKGGLILLTGLVSIILAIGAIYVFGARREEEKKAD
ncbi:hypothetical protein [Methanoregula sp.]|uniref:hypothetical protein n=1 Tax=Methanoregula sp. TaxID=2052170 RepID=UPI0023742683|nr:hypothetical protein [Methanoregula sp.]MDD1686981.1 hypothetical protein [Methanoregula sp.]